MRIYTTEKVSEGQNWAMLLSWKKAILVMWLLWWPNFSRLSKKLPILWVCGEGELSAVIKGELKVVDGFGEGCGVSDDDVQFVNVQLKTLFIHRGFNGYLKKGCKCYGGG